MSLYGEGGGNINNVGGLRGGEVSFDGVWDVGEKKEYRMKSEIGRDGGVMEEVFSDMEKMGGCDSYGVILGWDGRGWMKGNCVE